MALAQTSESVLHAITPGVCQDLFYAGTTNTQVQCFNALNDNRFVLTPSSQTFGSSSSLIFNPTQGLSDIVITATLPSATSASNNTGVWGGYALPAGWLAASINTVALRIGGSSLYYWTGAQILIDTLAMCENGTKQQAVFNKAGAALYQGVPTLTPGSPAATVTQMPVNDPTNPLYAASIYLKMPFNVISSLQKTLPLNSDILTQPVQFIITFNPVANWAFPMVTSPTLANLPTAFQTLTARFRQTTLVNSEHLISRRHDMNSQMLVSPLRDFAQTEFTTQTAAVAAGTPFSINATGLRSGSIKWIDVWVTGASSTGAGNNFNYVPISSLSMLVNGLVYYQADNYEASFWNLCDSPVPLSFAATQYALTAATTNTLTYTLATPQWYRIQLGQRPQVLAYENDMSLGLNIANSVVNLNITAGGYSGSQVLTVHCVYHYACNLIGTKGTMEYLVT